MTNIHISKDDLKQDLNEEVKNIKQWGIYDTKDNLWLGDNSGPKVFYDYTLARIAAQVCEDQVFGSDLLCRYAAKELPERSNWNKKDEVPTKHTTLESLERIEGYKSGDGK